MLNVDNDWRLKKVDYKLFVNCVKIVRCYFGGWYCKRKLFIIGVYVSKVKK